MICHDNMMIIQSPRGTQSKKQVGTELVQDVRKIHRGRFRQAAPNAGGKLRRVAMSQDPAIGGQSTYSLDQQRKNGHAENLAAWCCLQSKSGKSRAGSCESTGGALRPDNISDNASSGCSVFWMISRKQRKYHKTNLKIIIENIYVKFIIKNQN